MKVGDTVFQQLMLKEEQFMDIKTKGYFQASYFVQSFSHFHTSLDQPFFPFHSLNTLFISNYNKTSF